MEAEESLNKANGKQKMILLLFILLSVVGAAGGGWWWYMNTKYVSTDDARIAGTIVSVSAKIPGKVTDVLVKEGDQVKIGQVIARIDAREAGAQKLQAQAALLVAKAKYEELLSGSRPQEIGQAQAGVEQARANVEQAKATLDNAAKNYERMQKLFIEGAVSAAQRDSAQASYMVAKEAVNATVEAAHGAVEKLDLAKVGNREEAIRAAEAQVKQAEAALAAASVVTEYTEILSPVNGTIALKSVNPGEVVAAGQPLFSVTDLSDVWLNARIEETKIGKLKTGQVVEYTIDGYPDRSFEGSIYDIGTAANSVFALIPTENSSGTFTKVTQRIPVKITLPKDDNVVFRPGMSAIIKIHVK